MTTRIQPPSNFAMRLDAADKTALLALASSLNRSQVDTIRILVRNADFILPELKARAVYIPKTKTGRPRKKIVN